MAREFCSHVGGSSCLRSSSRLGSLSTVLSQKTCNACLPPAIAAATVDTARSLHHHSPAPIPSAPLSCSYINFYGNFRGRKCAFSGWLVEPLDSGAADDLYIAMKVIRDQRKAAGLI